MGNATSTEKFKLTITRTLNAPRDLVFDCWTQDEHLARWGGAPEGMTATAERKEIREGGHYRVHLRDAEGNTHTVQGQYLEVVKPERLVFTHAWIGADGEAGPEMLVTITFTAVDGTTKMTLHQEGFTSAASRDGHELGWGSQMERFIIYVNQLAA